MKLLLINPNARQAVTGKFGPVVIGSRTENALAQHSALFASGP